MIFKRIGIFDSGIGGLSLLKEIITIPGIEFIYYADTAHVPYGNRSKEEIQQLSHAAVQFLVQQNVDAIIIACHTATTNAVDSLKEQFPNIYFIDVVDLIVNQTIMSSPKKIGILGTHATIATGIHEVQISQALPNCDIITQECPLLASAIENDYSNQAYLFKLVKEYTQSLVDAGVDSVILACTHYSLIRSIITQVFNSTTQLICAEQNLKKKLEPFIDSSQTKPSTVIWYSTDDQKEFLAKATLILN